MVDNLDQKDFKKRLRHIERSTRKSARAKGAKRTGVMDWNEEQRRAEKKFRFSFGGFLKIAFLLWICFFILKGFLAGQMGRAEYEARVAELRAGSQGEKIASYALERGYLWKRWDEFMNKVEASKASEEAASGESEAPATEGEASGEAPASESSTNSN